SSQPRRVKGAATQLLVQVVGEGFALRPRRNRLIARQIRVLAHVASLGAFGGLADGFVPGAALACVLAGFALCVRVVTSVATSSADHERRQRASLAANAAHPQADAFGVVGGYFVAAVLIAHSPRGCTRPRAGAKRDCQTSSSSLTFSPSCRRHATTTSRAWR